MRQNAVSEQRVLTNSLSLPKCTASRLLEAAGSPLNGICGKAGKGLADFAQLITDLTKMQEFVTLTDLIEEVMIKSGYIVARLNMSIPWKPMRVSITCVSSYR